MLAADEARTDEIAITSAVGLRDRALIGLMVYTFARVGTVIKGILAHLENRLGAGQHPEHPPRAPPQRVLPGLME